VGEETNKKGVGKARYLGLEDKRKPASSFTMKRTAKAPKLITTQGDEFRQKRLLKGGVL